MRSPLANLTATVSVRIGDGEPADVATIDIPITVTAALHGADIVVHGKQVNDSLANALRTAADQLGPDTRKRTIEMHVHSTQDPEAIATTAANAIDFEAQRG